MDGDTNHRIVYLTYPPSEIVGGIKMAFRHVEVLREAGIEAVVATPGGERQTWFESTAPVIDIAHVAAESDILVFPENHPGMLRHFAAWANCKLVFCQNQFMVVRGLQGCADYAAFGVAGILCVGHYVADFCRRRFPSQPLHILPIYIDRELFHFPPEKRLQIAFTPNKRPMEAAFIQDLFRAENPEFRSIPWVAISNMPEQQVAQVLRESAVYLALCRFEAVPLTALEALASGCITAGFTGFGGREYATARNGFWADEDDCIGCAGQLARAVRLATEGGSRYHEMLESADYSVRYYTRERFARRTVKFWQDYLSLGRFPETPS